VGGRTRTQNTPFPVLNILGREHCQKIHFSQKKRLETKVASFHRQKGRKRRWFSRWESISHWFSISREKELLTISTQESRNRRFSTGESKSHLIPYREQEPLILDREQEPRILYRREQEPLILYREQEPLILYTSEQKLLIIKRAGVTDSLHKRAGATDSLHKSAGATHFLHDRTAAVRSGKRFVRRRWEASHRLHERAGGAADGAIVLPPLGVAALHTAAPPLVSALLRSVLRQREHLFVAGNSCKEV
jgi:hypothetical protein